MARIASKNIVLALVITFFGMLAAQGLADLISGPESFNHLVFATLVSVLIVPLITLLHYKSSSGDRLLLGIENTVISIKKFLLGISLILVPFAITLIMTLVFGWAELTINIGQLSGLGVGLLTVFLMESLPEELVFRGYIFGTLNLVLKKWQAMIMSVTLFVLFPIILTAIQGLLGLEISIGGNDSITGSYVLTLLFFGFLVQYIRIVTTNIWTGIGFHLFFVFSNRLMGESEDFLIQVGKVTSETPMQITFISLILLVFSALLLYPKITKQSLNWNTKSTPQVST